MPSFTLDVSNSAFGKPTNVLSGRLNGDEFVRGRGLSTLQFYNASRGLMPCWYFGLESEDLTESEPLMDQKQQYDGNLVVKGIIVDIIDHVSPHLASGTLPQACLELGGWTNDRPIDRVPDDLWRTLVADRGPDGKNAPPWYARACLHALQRVTRNGDLEISSQVLSSSTPATIITFLERVKAVTWNRRLIKTNGVYTRDGGALLGLAPPKTKRGDIVAILFGCSVPVVLRKHISEGREHYAFIGEAYVHGIMDGGAVARRDFSIPYENAETFTLR